MGAPRQTQRDRWKGRPVIIRYHAYRDELNLKLPGYQLGRELDIIFNLPMPASWSEKKKRSMAGRLHDQKPDLDNLIKGFTDAFHAEDKQLAIIKALKVWAYEGAIKLVGYEIKKPNQSDDLLF